MSKLLLVDDDQTLATLLKALLTQQGYELLWADRPSKGLTLLSERPEVLLLDVMLPEQDGFSFCQKLRAQGNNIPIIMLTARGDDTDKITGLNLGADDYLPKPFNHLELIARIEAIRRRQRGASVVVADGLDREQKLYRLGGQEIPLTPMEYRLLDVLTNTPGRTFSRAELISHLDDTGSMESLDRAIDIHISRLRTKIEADPKHPRHLITVRGFGYRFER